MFMFDMDSDFPTKVRTILLDYVTVPPPPTPRPPAPTLFPFSMYNSPLLKLDVKYLFIACIRGRSNSWLAAALRSRTRPFERPW